MLKLLETLCSLRGVSSDEGPVRDFIRARLEPVCEVKEDPVGNLIAVRRGLPKPKNKIALFAHMDEVGVMVTRITEEGLLKFSPIGIDPRVLHGRGVLVGPKGLPGVIGGKAWHHLTAAERDAKPSADGYYIDIGASSAGEARAEVSPGDTAAFDEPFRRLGGETVASRALDNRIGCAMLIRLLESDLPFEATGCFTVCEESGLLGAAAAAFSAAPDAAVILETTTAGDVDGAPAEKTVCRVGAGPVVSFADNGTLYDREFYRLAFDLAAKNGIKIQTKEGVFGGNEARAVTRSRGGVRTIAQSVPCRYLHSASCVAALGDIAGSERHLHARLPARAGR